MKNLLVICTMLLTGCAGIDKAMTGASSVPTKEERQKSVDRYPGLTADQKAQFVEGQPWIGMTTEQLAGIWGNEPAKTQKKLTVKGNEETQLYKVRIGDWKSGIKTKYYKVSTLAGKVTEIQELDENVGSFDRL